jgi:tetratricopeptide (TPR) repeat protein
MIKRSAIAVIMTASLPVAANASWEKCDDLANAASAIHSCTKVIESKLPQDKGHRVGAYLRRGMLFFEQGQRGRALKDFQEALQHDPHSVVACVMSGVVRYKIDRYGRDAIPADMAAVSRAIDHFSTCIQLTPSQAMGYFARANARTIRGDYLLAISDLSRVISLEKQGNSRLDALLKRAAVYETLGRNADAVADYSAVIEAMPELSLAYIPRAHVFEKLGQFERAKLDYLTALKLEPGNQKISAELERPAHQQGLDKP